MPEYCYKFMFTYRLMYGCVTCCCCCYYYHHIIIIIIIIIILCHRFVIIKYFTTSFQVTVPQSSWIFSEPKSVAHRSLCLPTRLIRDIFICMVSLSSWMRLTVICRYSHINEDWTSLGGSVHTCNWVTSFLFPRRLRACNVTLEKCILLHITG
jgi:hypothetical protein